MKDLMNPTPALLCKLGSIIVHAQELLSPHGHRFDRIALDDLLKDAEVQAWLRGMSRAALLPEPRNKP